MRVDETPPIRSRSVTLRHFEPEDAHKVFEMSRESGMRAWLPDQVYDNETKSLDVLRYLIKAYRDPGNPAIAPYVLGVCLGDTPELIGHVGLSPLSEQVEVGYAIEDRYQGKGYASEAVRAMVEWALPRFGLPLVLGVVTRENPASCKVLKNAGFELAGEREGTLHGRPGLIRTYQRRVGVLRS